MPNLFKKAGSFTNALMAHALDGFSTVSDKIKQERMGVCEACEHRRGDECTKCGCNLHIKTAWATSECPIKKWLSVSGADSKFNYTPEPPPCNCGNS